MSDRNLAPYFLAIGPLMLGGKLSVPGATEESA